ncbi:nucleoredoxin [Plakobranchus ocellatus]|uniref:Nucleoredoxin n=1 Tax=Plakobranchus ocellatus TaxID=259542 RepID=A0AAV3YWI0_9GAST|nr:nucleoredoxin [Plakobranchus ocellatus]
MLVYNELKKTENFFEVIYISLDNKESSFEDYFATMPWYAIPYSDEEKRVRKIHFRGIPILVLLDAKTLDIIALNGREILFRDPRGELFPWKNLPEEKSSIDSAKTMQASDSTGGASDRKRPQHGVKKENLVSSGTIPRGPRGAAKKTPTASKSKKRQSYQESTKEADDSDA